MKRLISSMMSITLVGIMSAAPAESQKNNTHKSTIAKPTVHTQEKSELFLIDTLEAIIFSPDSTELITHSDVVRPSLMGGMRTLDEIVLDRLMYADAKKHKIPMDESVADRYLNAIQKQYDIGLEEVKQLFAQAGYSYQEGRLQLQMMQAVNTMLDYKIRANLIIPRKQVEEYYAANPEVEPAQFTLQRAEVPYAADVTPAAQKSALERRIKMDKDIDALSWSEPFTVVLQDLAADKQFIASMEPGQVKISGQTQEGFELYRLKEAKQERLLSLEERYRDIVDTLKEPKYQELLKEYKEYLFSPSFASIIYFQ